MKAKHLFAGATYLQIEKLLESFPSLVIQKWQHSGFHWKESIPPELRNTVGRFVRNNFKRPQE